MASEDQVLSDPETKVGGQVGGGTQVGACAHGTLLTLGPLFADHGKGFSIQNTQDPGPSSVKPHTDGAASTDQVRCLLCTELPWLNR